MNGPYSARTVPVQCPYSARTVPVQCPHSARCKKWAFAHVALFQSRAITEHHSLDIARCENAHFLHRALYGHCTGTVRALSGHCAGTARYVDFLAFHIFFMEAVRKSEVLTMFMIYAISIEFHEVSQATVHLIKSWSTHDARMVCLPPDPRSSMLVLHAHFPPIWRKVFKVTFQH